MNEQQFRSLPEDQRIAAQQRLIELGLYNGRADGKWGAGTDAAFKLEAKQRADREQRDRDAASREREDKRKSDELELRRMELQQSGKKTDVEAAETARKTRAREERAAQAGSIEGTAAQIGASTVAPVAGLLVGRAAGLGTNALMDASQRSRNAVLAGLAEDRRAGLTTVEGAREAALASGAMPLKTPLFRVMGRMAPHFALGGAVAGKGGLMLSQADDEAPFYPEMANKAAALALIGAGSGIAERGITYGVAPGEAPDARSMGVIGSNRLIRGNQGTPPASSLPPAAPPPAARPTPSTASSPAPGTKRYLREQAQSLGIKGSSGMSKADLADAVSTKLAEHGGKRTVGKRIPKVPGGTGAAALAGGLAYALTPENAEAADGSALGSQADALTNAAGAAAVGYGANRLLRRLPPAVGKALAVGGQALATGGQMMAPFAAADLSDSYAMDDQQKARDRNWVARNIPGASYLPGELGRAYDMAQVPERGDRSPEAMQARTPDNDFDMALEDLRALLAAGQSGGDDDEGAPPMIGSQPMQVSPMAYFPVMAPDNRLLRRF